MNILFLTFQGDTAGSTFSLTYLAQGLEKRGHLVYIGCRPTSYFWRLMKHSSVKLIPMKFRRRLDLESIREVAKAVIENRIDIINAQSSVDRYNSIFANWLYSLKRSVIHTRRQMPLSIGFLFQNWFYTIGTKRIVAVSNGVKKGLLALGIPKSHISVIYNGTPPEKYSNISWSKTEELKINLSISRSDFVIGCVSRRKKQNQLLKALQYIEKPVTCIFVGIDKIVEDQPMLNAVNKKHRIHFTGIVNENDALCYYNLFSIHILPSTTEGFSQALLEAMALQVPVIATNASGNNELINHGENGFLFDDNDCKGIADLINTLRASNELRKKFSKRGYHTALKTYSIERTIDGYEKLFADCISGNRCKSLYP